jgi:hypothetical protein
VRSATILGFCGAGGIGFLKFDKLNGYLYREVATMMIMVIISVSIIDYLCGKLRTQFIRRLRKVIYSGARMLRNFSGAGADTAMWQRGQI